MKKFFLLLVPALLAVSCSTSRAPQDKLTVNDKKIDQLIAQMTLEEKVNMLHSKTNMSSAGVERLGIADMHYADGPFGIREEGVPNGFQSAGWKLDSATYFPTGSALAATWSREMAYLYGTGMGTEARLRGKDVILGPAVNIQRLPVGGRTYEYLSEDPILSAALSLQYTLGVQDKGTAVCIKHFAVNNQETNRGSVDAQVDERTLREIYLKPFESADHRRRRHERDAGLQQGQRRLLLRERAPAERDPPRRVGLQGLHRLRLGRHAQHHGRHAPRPERPDDGLQLPGPAGHRLHQGGQAHRGDGQ